MEMGKYHVKQRKVYLFCILKLVNSLHIWSQQTLDIQ